MKFRGAISCLNPRTALGKSQGRRWTMAASAATASALAWRIIQSCHGNETSMIAMGILHDFDMEK